MSSYTKPQVNVFQDFRLVPTEITEPLRALIAGPHADLHRYSDAEEKPTIKLGAYNRLAETDYAWPGRDPGGVIDMNYVKLYLDDALLLYFSDLISAGSLITAVSGRTNWIQSNTLAFKSNGTAYPRSAAFLDRDVKLGDTVYLRCVEDDEACTEHELWTYVTGFASETVASDVDAAVAEDDNQADTTASVSIEKIGGADNCITAEVVDPSNYDGLLAGDVEEEYVIEVTKSSVAGCNAARLRVTSASGNDDVADVTPADWGEETAIGTRGLAVIFDPVGASECSASAEDDDVAPMEFIVGQKWRVTVTQAFTAAAATSGGTYTGPKNDIYIIECTKGGLWADLPEITVTTQKGLDFSGPTEVTGADVATAIGRYGVTVEFDEDGLRAGDKWYITVVSEAAGPVRKLILKHDLSAVMRAATELDLRLFIKDDIQVSKNREGFAPLLNFETSTTLLTVNDGIVAYHPEWTSSGVEAALTVWSGTLYVEFREWLSDLCRVVSSINDVADLGNIKGPLDPDNPLKWGVYKALTNSNGTAVKYISVCSPDDLDDWTAALSRIKGRDDLYNLVPLSNDLQVHNLFAAHADDESNEQDNNWKGIFVPLKNTGSKLLAGEGALIGGVLGAAVDDVVVATLTDNPNASGTQYTLLSVTGGNGYFITNNVQPGDTVRYLYTTDGFGDESYEEFVVDSVLSEDSLLLFSGHDAAVNVAQKIEIWHTLDDNELSEAIAQQGGTFSNRRVCGVWPDQVGEAGLLQEGYFLCAALAGLVSGVVPHQGLTNVEVKGFDDYSRSFQLFNSTQLDRMAEAGVWIVTEDRDGTPHTRHALTTDNTDLNRREEMIRRNVDSMSYLFLRRLKPFIGRSNVTPSLLRRLNYEITTIIEFLANNETTEELGPQLISGTIRILQQHPLLADRVEVVLDLVVPAPLNNLELHLVV
jgi:hypothetical protein